MPADLTAVLKLELPIVVRIGERTLPLREVISLGPGAVIELDKPIDEEIDLLVNDKPIASGRAVKVGGNFGIRISRVGDRSARMRAVESRDDPSF